MASIITDLLHTAVHGDDCSRSAGVDHLDTAAHARDRAHAAAMNNLLAGVHGGNRAAATRIYVLTSRGASVAAHGDRRAYATGIDFLDTIQNFHGAEGRCTGDKLYSLRSYAGNIGSAASLHFNGTRGKGIGVVINRDAVHHLQCAAREGVVPIIHWRTISILEYGPVTKLQYAPAILGTPGSATIQNLGAPRASAGI